MPSMPDRKIAALTMTQIASEYASPSNYGVYFASTAFLRALIKYGEWDEYHIINLGDSEQNLRRMWEHALGASLESMRLKIVNYFDFLDNIHQDFYSILLEGECFVQAAAIRNLCGDHVPPIVGHTHSISYNFLANALLGTMMNPIRPWDGLMCTTPSAQTIISQLANHLKARAAQPPWNLSLEFPPEMEVIPLAVNVERYKPRDKNDIRKLLGVDPEAFVLLYVGRLSERDKMDMLPALLSVYRTSQIEPTMPLSFIIAGDDSNAGYIEYLNSRIAEMRLLDKVRIVTPLSEAEKPLYYSMADAFISLSDNVQETFGLTLAEAMASGLPMIVSDWDGYKHIVQHNTNGFLSPTLWRSPSAEFEMYTNLTPYTINHYRINAV